MHPNFVLLGAFKKNDWKKKSTDRPKYSEIPLEGNTTFFSFSSFFFGGVGVGGPLSCEK